MAVLYPARWRRRSWLLLIGGAHVLALWGWQAPERPSARPRTRQAAITYVLPLRQPAVPLPAPRLPLPQARPATPAAPAAPQAARAAAAASQAAVAPAADRATAEPVPEPAAITAAPDPFAVPAKPQADLRQRAVAAAFAADQAVRKESFTQRDRKLVNDETALAAAIGKAWRGGGPMQTVELLAPDGTRITKFIMPNGAAVCYQAAPNTFSGGRDPFRDSGKVAVVRCPQ